MGYIEEASDVALLLAGVRGQVIICTYHVSSLLSRHSDDDAGLL